MVSYFYCNRICQKSNIFPIGNLADSVPDPVQPDPHVFGDPDPLVRGMDPDPDPSIIKQK
jgi:hypothetical protein